MYITVAQLVKDGKRIGFVFNIVVNQSLNQIEMLDEEVKDRLLRGEQFDIYFSGTKFYFKDNRKISKLPKVKQKIKNTIKCNHTVVLDVYTGGELKNFVQNKIRGYKERDFVQCSYSYLTKHYNMVLAIAGLKGSGVTTGLLQIVSKINDYNNTVFISVDEKADMDCLDLKIELLKYRDKKYIFIDEITRVKGFIRDLSFLYEDVFKSGKRVVIGGTRSLGFIDAQDFRLFVNYVNQMTYKEAKQTLNYTLEKYMSYGGSFNLVNNLENLKNYIDTVLVDNILNTLAINTKIKFICDISGISRIKLRTIIFRILYEIIYCNIQGVNSTTVTYLSDIFDYNKVAFSMGKYLNKLVCKHMQTEEVIITNVAEIKCIISILEEFGVLAKVENVYNQNDYIYYITNPGIVNQIVLDICNNMNVWIISLKDLIVTDKYKELIIENILAVHILKVVRENLLECYYCYASDNRKLSLLVANEEQFAREFYLYEIKWINSVNVDVLQSKWLCEQNVAQTFYGEIETMNKAVVFKSLNNKNLVQIAEENYGIDLISIEDFLMNLNQIYDKIEY